MTDDISKLDQAQKILLEAMDHAVDAVTSIESGTPGEAQSNCSKFLNAVEESQILLLQVASHQRPPLPYAFDASAARLEVAALQLERQVQQGNGQ